MATAAPCHIAMHPSDNAIIIANDGGLPAGTELDNGIVLRGTALQRRHRPCENRSVGRPLAE